jgi:hypothetical protein
VWYSGVDDLDDKDSEFVDFVSDYRFERASVGLRGAYKRDTLLRSLRFVPDAIGEGEPPEGEYEVDEDLDDINDSPDVDAGQTRDQIRRTRSSISPGVSYRFSDRTNATLRYTFLKLDYDDTNAASGVRESETNAVMGAVKHRLSERDTLSSSLRVARFEPDGETDTDTQELNAGWRREFTEQTTGTLELGARRVETDTDEQTGMLYRARIDHLVPRGQLTGSIERSLYPSSFGEIVETDRVRFAYRHSLAERWALTVDANALSTESAAGTNSRRNRDYAEARASLVYAAHPEWLVGLNYGFRWVERDDDTGSATGNSISLSLSYRPIGSGR